MPSYSPATQVYIAQQMAAVAGSVLAQFGGTGNVVQAGAQINATTAPDWATLTPSFVALFQAPFDDQQYTNTQLVTSYTAIFNELVAYNVDISSLSTATQDLLIRFTTASNFNSACQCACFAALCEAMAGKAQQGEYQTADAVTNDLATLDSAWASVCNGGVDPGVRMQLSDMLSRVSAILNNLAVTLPNIVPLMAPAIPVSVLSYWLYDTDQQTDTLIALNPRQPPWLYNGAAQILSN